MHKRSNADPNPHPDPFLRDIDPDADLHQNVHAVFRMTIWIRIMFLALPDTDEIVKGMEPNPSIIKLCKSTFKKIIISNMCLIVCCWHVEGQ